MCGAAGGGRWKAGFFYYYYFIFRSGQDYFAARLEIEEEKGTAAERVWLLTAIIFVPTPSPVGFRLGGGGGSPAPPSRLAVSPGSGREEMGWGEGRRRESLPSTLRAGLQGAGEPGTRVRGEAERGVAQPGRSPANPPSPALFPHAGRPLCSPLPPSFPFSHTPPPPPHFLARVGDVCWEDGSWPE